MLAPFVVKRKSLVHGCSVGCIMGVFRRRLCLADCPAADCPRFGGLRQCDGIPTNDLRVEVDILNRTNYFSFVFTVD